MRQILLVVLLLGLVACAAPTDHVPAPPRDERPLHGLQGPVSEVKWSTRYTEWLPEQEVRLDSQYLAFDSLGRKLVHRFFVEGELTKKDSVEWNEWGEKVSEIRWQRRKGKMTRWLETEWRYGEEGKLAEERQLDGEGKMQLQRIFQRDDRGRVETVITNHYRGDGGAEDFQTRSEIQYQDSSNVKTEVRRFQAGNLRRIEYFLEGKKVRDESYSSQDPGRLTGWTVYEYDMSGDFQRQRKYDGQGQAIWRELRLYDSEGKEFEVRRENGRSEPMFRKTQDFNDENDPVYRIMQIFDAYYDDGRSVPIDTTPDTTLFAYQYDPEPHRNWVWKEIKGPIKGNLELHQRQISYHPGPKP